MPLFPEAGDIALRILLTAIAAIAIGFERGESGKAAGMRTTLLVGLAACFAMIEANLLLSTSGRSADAFVSMDVMRLPLGILTGVGFIGAGAILRRNNMVIGVTTAATLWYVTILGLCFGSGQLWLGVVGLVLGLAVIWALQLVEPNLPRDRQARLTIRYDRSRIGLDALIAEVVTPPYTLMHATSDLSTVMGTGEARLYLRWRSRGLPNKPPELVELLARHDGIQHVNWEPSGMPSDW